MHVFKQKITRLARTTRDRGASAVEYGLMVAAIAALIVGTVFALGGFVRAAFSKTCSAIQVQGSVESNPGCEDTGGDTTGGDTTGGDTTG